MVVTAGREHRHREERGAHEAEDHEARDRPTRNLRRQQDVEDEQRDRGKVEQAMGEDRSDQRRARPLAVVRKAAAKDGDACELTCPCGQNGISEESDAERPEDLRVARVRFRERLVHRELPRDRSGHDREEVDEDRDDDPAPGDGVEGIPDRSPVRSTPPDRGHRGNEHRERHAATQPRAPRPAREPHAAARRSRSTSDV